MELFPRLGTDAAIPLIVLVLVTGCRDVTQPSVDHGTDWQRFQRSAAALMLGDTTQCPDVDGCGTAIVQDTARCLCKIDGIGVNVPGGDGYPGTFPEWPDPPGFPDPDFGDWPEPPGGGSWPNLPPPEPGECDPYGFINSCFFEASLTCPISVERGTVGTCELELDRSDALDQVVVWTFNGEGGAIHASWGVNSTTWSGTLVHSGTVRVEFYGQGRLMELASVVTVEPRTSGVWTQAHWESQIDFVQGQGAAQCGASRPISGVPFGWTGSLAEAQSCQGQQIEPIGAQAYNVSEVQSGPNAGAWWVPNASFYFESTSQLSPGVFPSAPNHTLTNSGQQNLCRTAMGLPAGSPVSINFWDYNNQCVGVSGWGAFVQAVWDHERQHFDQAEAELKVAGNNIYTEIESIVGASAFDAHTDVTTVYNRIQQAADIAGGVEPTGNWTIPFWIWVNLSSNVFYSVPNPNF